MIREHTFNSQWWGAKVGIISDPAFFSLGESEQQGRLSEYAWVEFVAPFDTVSPYDLARAGFLQTDTQIGFKVDLRRLPVLPGFTDLEVEIADDTPFSVDLADLPLFEHERFRYLPGITPEKLNGRYALWSKALITSQPQWCLRIMHGFQVEGWFLSERDEGGFNLTLASLHRDASISGMLLYQKALSTYAQRGQYVGGARFSVTNSPVHNIYAGLGARFLAPSGCWLWVRPHAAGSC